MAQLDRDDFVSTVAGNVPARPLNMEAIVATNRGQADMPWAMPTTAAEVEAVEVASLDARPPEAIVVDVREPAEYAEGHVPGAINIPQASLASRLDELSRDRPIFAICRSGARSLRAAQFLRQVGFEQVVNVAGGTDSWRAAGKPLAVGETTGDQPRISESQWTHAGVHAAAS